MQYVQSFKAWHVIRNYGEWKIDPEIGYFQSQSSLEYFDLQHPGIELHLELYIKKKNLENTGRSIKEVFDDELPVD